MKRKTGIEAAISAAGSKSELARLTGYSRQNIQQWAALGKVPMEKAPAIERATGIRCERLCPNPDWATLRGVK
jgi:DNA-binding transcriptional regulator YdaS (Cro superfamily)